MHPTLATFADRYRHAFPDLVITGTDDDLRLEWQEGPEAPCYTVTARMSGEGFIVFEYSRGRVRDVVGHPLDSAVIALNREHWWSSGSPILAAPGTFGALVLERRLLRDSAIRPNSPDRLT